MGNSHSSLGCKSHGHHLTLLHILLLQYPTFFSHSDLVLVSREEEHRAKMRISRVTSKDQPFLEKQKFTDLLGNRE